MDTTTSNVMLSKLKRPLSKGSADMLSDLDNTGDDGDSSDSDADAKERLHTIMGGIDGRDDVKMNYPDLVDTEFRRASDRLSANIQSSIATRNGGGMVLDDVIASTDHNMMNKRYETNINF